MSLGQSPTLLLPVSFGTCSHQVGGWAKHQQTPVGGWGLELCCASWKSDICSQVPSGRAALRKWGRVATCCWCWFM